MDRCHGVSPRSPCWWSAGRCGGCSGRAWAGAERLTRRPRRLSHPRRTSCCCSACGPGRRRGVLIAVFVVLEALIRGRLGAGTLRDLRVPPGCPGHGGGVSGYHWLVQREDRGVAPAAPAAAPGGPAGRSARRRTRGSAAPADRCAGRRMARHGPAWDVPDVCRARLLGPRPGAALLAARRGVTGRGACRRPAAPATRRRPRSWRRAEPGPSSATMPSPVALRATRPTPARGRGVAQRRYSIPEQAVGKNTEPRTGSTKNPTTPDQRCDDEGRRGTPAAATRRPVAGRSPTTRTPAAGAPRRPTTHAAMVRVDRPHHSAPPR